MSFFRSLLFLCLISLLAAGILLAFASFTDNSGYISGYAVLTTDSSVDDKTVLNRLEQGKESFAGEPVSLSVQWVLLDEFDSINAVPLDYYSNRLYPFDPRNDGYADKLKNIFINDDKRFIYIPVKTDTRANIFLDKHFENLLAGIPYNIDYFYTGKPSSLFFIAYATVSLILVIIWLVKKNTRRSTAGIFFLLPALSSLSFFGVKGIVLAALLSGFSIMFREPLYEIFKSARLPKSKLFIKLKTIYKNIINPYKIHWFLLPLFSAAIIILILLTELNYLFILLLCASFGVIYISSGKYLQQSGSRRKRFTPVLIIKKKITDFSFSIYMAPFAVAAFIVMLLTPHMSSAYISDMRFENIIDENDYYEHLIFQSSFSMRQFGTQNTIYSEYFFDEDGLLSLRGSSYDIKSAVYIDDFPPFPLGNLMDFFISVNNSAKNNNTVHNTGKNEYVSLVILLLLIIPGFFIKQKSSPSFNFQFKTKNISKKRAARIGSRQDNKRINILMSKEKPSLLQKDA